MCTRNCLLGLFLIVEFSCEDQTSVEPRLMEQINSAPDNAGGTQVFSDDVEAGIFIGDEYEIIFRNGFEDQSSIHDIPFTLPVSPLKNVTEDFWYYKNEDAKVSITQSVQRDGSQSISCNASLVYE